MKNFKSFMEEGFGKYSDKIDKKKLMKKYKENEDNNAHTENYLMLAKFFGTEDEVAEIKKIMKRSKSSTCLLYTSPSPRDRG